jgi:hypothetical protein
MKFILSATLMFMAFMGPALACSCKIFTPEEIATQDKFEFIKLRINYPTVNEVWTRFQKRNSFQRPYTVSVLENIKGRFNYRELIVEVGDMEACGAYVSYGQTVHVIRLASETYEWGNFANLCNIKDEVKGIIEKKKFK